MGKIKGKTVTLFALFLVAAIGIVLMTMDLSGLFSANGPLSNLLNSDISKQIYDGSDGLNYDQETKDNVVFTFQTDYSGTVYFRNEAWGEFDDSSRSCSSVDLYKGTTTISPLGYYPTKVKDSGVPTHHITVNMKTVYNKVMVPNYSFFGLDGTKGSVNDCFIQEDKKESYTYETDFYPSDYVDDALIANSALNSKLVSEEAAYDSYVYGKYLSVDSDRRQKLEDYMSENNLDPNSSTFIKDVQSHFRSKFKYDKSASIPKNEDMIMYFLTVNKAGICNNFALASMMLYRTAGIPSRVVAGALGTSVANTECQITEMQIHAWTEIYISGSGWRSIDCTAPISYDSDKIDDLDLDDVNGTYNMDINVSEKSQESTTTYNGETQYPSVDDMFTVESMSKGSKEMASSEYEGKSLSDIIESLGYTMTVDYPDDMGQTNAGEYTYDSLPEIHIFDTDGTEVTNIKFDLNYDPSATSLSFNIEPAPIEVTYTNHEVELSDGLLAGTDTFEYELYKDPVDTEEDFKVTIRNLEGEDVTANYDITYINEVVKDKYFLYYTTEDVDETYDGEVHTVLYSDLVKLDHIEDSSGNVVDKTLDDIMYDDGITVKYAFDQKEYITAGIYTVPVSIIFYDENLDEVASQYFNIYVNNINYLRYSYKVKDPTYTLEKRKITVTYDESDILLSEDTPIASTDTITLESLNPSGYVTNENQILCSIKNADGEEVSKLNYDIEYVSNIDKIFVSLEYKNINTLTYDGTAQTILFDDVVKVKKCYYLSDKDTDLNLTSLYDVIALKNKDGNTNSLKFETNSNVLYNEQDREFYVTRAGAFGLIQDLKIVDQSDSDVTNVFFVVSSSEDTEPKEEEVELGYSASVYVKAAPITIAFTETEASIKGKYSLMKGDEITFTITSADGVIHSKKDFTYVIKNSDGEDVTDCYEPTKSNILTIKLKSRDVAKFYNGQAQSPSVDDFYEVVSCTAEDGETDSYKNKLLSEIVAEHDFDGDGSPENETIDFKINFESKTSNGHYRLRLQEFKILDADGNDVTNERYKITYVDDEGNESASDSITKHYFDINKRVVVVQYSIGGKISDVSVKGYDSFEDGELATLSGYSSISKDDYGVLSTDVISFAKTGSSDTITSDASFSVTIKNALDDTDKTSNYEIIPEELK